MICIDRLSLIEKNNLILLERMMTIMKRPSGIDNSNPITKSTHKSLNREARKREVERINEVNKVKSNNTKTENFNTKIEKKKKLKKKINTKKKKLY